MKKRFHTWLIKHLLKGDSIFAEKDIDTEKRTIYLGFYGMRTAFMTPKHDLIISLLVAWYKYKCFETRFVIHYNQHSTIKNQQ